MSLRLDNPLSVDLHVHTVASGHAFSTIGELVHGAEERTVRVIGIADHGPRMDGAPHEGYFTMASDARRAATTKCTVLFGCELNILSEEGDVDLSSEVIRGLDFVLAGLHERTPYAIQEHGSKLNNTKALVNCIERVRPTVVSHPITSSFPIDLEPVIRSAQENRVLLEINARVLRRANAEHVVSDYLQLIGIAAKFNTQLIIGSDCHILSDLGNVKSLNPLQGALEETSDLIINRDAASFSLWQSQRAGRAE